MAPRAYKRGLLAASFLLIAPHAVSAQSSYPQSDSHPPLHEKRALSSAGNMAAARYEQLRVSHSLVERAQAMQDPFTRARAVIDMAGRLQYRSSRYHHWSSLPQSHVH